MTEVKIIKNNIVFIVPQKDNSFIENNEPIDFDKHMHKIILFMTNIDVARVHKMDLPGILKLIGFIREKFPNFTPNIKLFSLIDSYINDLFSQSFWVNVSSLIDCGFDKMDRRRFPYFHSKDQSWKDLNAKHSTNDNSYPVEFNGEPQEEKVVLNTRAERKAAWKEIEQKAVNMINKLDINATEPTVFKGYTPDNGNIKTNNYNTIQLLEPQFYPDFEEYRMMIELLCMAGITRLARKLICILPLTYNCCGIIKESWYWQICNELIIDTHLKNYILYYAMYILKMEENRSYNSVATNARFIFTLEEAQLIASNISKIGIDKNPLVHLMEPLGYKSSYMPYYLDGDRFINSYDVFRRRLSIATGGLLDNISLSDYSAILSGSILVPCVATNPLEARFKNYADSFKNYLECYYPSYDSVNDSEIVKYIEPIQTDVMYQKQKKEDLSGTTNLCDDIEQSTSYGVLSDLDISIHVPTFDEFKIQAYKLFEDIRNRSNKAGIYMRRIKRGNNFKYSIYGLGIIRPIDLFWITRSPETFVEQFHLGVVRMFWDGIHVKIMQSALAALLTGINHDYRWLSSSKAPPLHVIKYAQRGYSTPLNKNERPILIEYLCGKKEWANSIKTQTTSIENIFGVVRENNLFFLPDVTKSGIRYGLKEVNYALSNINNNRLNWIPITCSSYGISLEYYNESRNSVGCPRIEDIDKIISRIDDCD